MSSDRGQNLVEFRPLTTMALAAEIMSESHSPAPSPAELASEISIDSDQNSIDVGGAEVAGNMVKSHRIVVVTSVDQTSCGEGRHKRIGQSHMGVQGNPSLSLYIY